MVRIEIFDPYYEEERYNCCCLLSNDEILIGTTKGKVIKRKLKPIEDIKNLEQTLDNDFIGLLDDNSEVILTFSGVIRSIQKISKTKCIILSSFGGIQIYDLISKDFEIINIERNEKHSKAWRLLVLDEFNFVTVGNYGQIIHWDIKDTVNKNCIYRDRHAFFCLDWYDRDAKIFFMNNYIGTCYLWKFENNEIIELNKSFLEGNIQKIEILDDYLLAITYSGKICAYLKNNATHRKVFEFNIRPSTGNWIYYSNLKNQIIAGTDDNLIYIDGNFQGVKELNISAKQIIEYYDIILILTNDNLVLPNYNKASPPITLRNYKYKKIGLVGDSQVGKTSFCKYLEQGDGSSIQSSFGIHVWSIPFSNSIDGDGIFENLERRILYFDLAGQKGEHFTYFPKIYNSDIILLFFQAIKPETFDQAINYYKELKEECPNAKFYFIQTFSEQRSRVRKDTISREFSALGLNIKEHLIELSSTTGKGYDIYQSKVLDTLEWNSAPAVFRLPIFDDFEAIIHDFYKNRTFDRLELNELKALISLDEKRLNLVAKSYYEQGYFDYIEDEKLILINNQEYAQIQSDIANLIAQNNGYANKNYIYESLDPDKKYITYITNILNYYRDNKVIAIFKEDDSNKETFIFPKKLKEDITINQDILPLLPRNHYNFEYTNFEVKIEELLNFFNEYPLNLKLLSKKELILIGDQPNNPVVVDCKYNREFSDSCKSLSLGVKKVAPEDYKMEREILNKIHIYLKDHISDLSFKGEISFLVEDLQDDENVLKKILNNPHERPYFDFKRELDLTNNENIMKFLKNVIALSNMAFLNFNIAFLIIGIEEENGNIIKLHDVSEIGNLEQQISQKIREYLFNHPNYEIINIKISDLYKWQCNGEIPDTIPFTTNQKSNECNEKIVIVKLKKIPRKVCEIKKEISFTNKRGKTVIYKEGDSWMRIGSHTYRITENYREIIRNKT
ncbi:MAG: RNA-binding domain-containing protein [Promethearchaeota archaeon]